MSGKKKFQNRIKVSLVTVNTERGVETEKPRNDIVRKIYT